MQVAELFVYPIKSCGGVSVASLNVSKAGIVHDRRWMLVDSMGTFITQREMPELATFSTHLEDDLLVVREPGVDAGLEIVLQEGSTKSQEPIQVWSRTISGVEHADGSAWFSARLGAEVRLVRCAPEAGLAFHDSAQVLVISQASLDDLNNRLVHPVPMSRFRPNIVLKGVDPFQEDSWKTLQTGAVLWEAEHRCGRCLVTTIDQVSGQRVGPDPLRTLAKYRLFGSEVCFGMYFSVADNGVVMVGDSAIPV